MIKAALWDGWDWMVIIGHRYSESNSGANNLYSCRKNVRFQARTCKTPACHHPPRLQILPLPPWPHLIMWIMICIYLLGRSHLQINSILFPPVGAGIDKRCVRTVRRVVLVLVQVPGQDVELHHVLVSELTWLRSSCWQLLCDQSAIEGKGQGWARLQGWSSGQGTDQFWVDTLFLPWPGQNNEELLPLGEQSKTVSNPHPTFIQS